jgi:hypothetical protein
VSFVQKGTYVQGLQKDLQTPDGAFSDVIGPEGMAPRAMHTHLQTDGRFDCVMKVHPV